MACSLSHYHPASVLLAAAIVLCLVPRPVQAQAVDSTAVADSLLIQELAREMARENPGAPVQAAPRARASTNPDISVIGDARAWYVSEGERNVDFEFHEAEMALRAAVDPFARGDVFVSMAHEDGEFVFELEEAYLTTLSLPFRLQARAGKFRSTVGKINRLHPHALPFIDVPAVYANFFGDEGLNDQGLSLSWLVPNPAFYQEWTAEVTRGPGESPSFTTSEGNRFLYTTHLKNFWDLSADATLEVGLSGLAGPNDAGETTWMGGADVTFIWKPVRFNTYHSFTVQAEVFGSRRDGPGTRSVAAWGGYGLVQYQLARRWYVTGRVDHADLPDDPDWDETVFSGTLAWYATEFQKIEVGARTVSADGIDRYLQALVRLVFVIGTHGAHEY